MEWEYLFQLFSNKQQILCCFGLIAALVCGFSTNVNAIQLINVWSIFRQQTHTARHSTINPAQVACLCAVRAASTHQIAAGFQMDTKPLLFSIYARLSLKWCNKWRIKMMRRSGSRSQCIFFDFVCDFTLNAEVIYARCVTDIWHCPSPTRNR